MTTYSTGTVSIGNGSTTLAGASTAWATAGLQAGDMFMAAGDIVPIAAIVSATEITLARPWPGSALSAANYNILPIIDDGRALTAFNLLNQALSGGTLTSLAGLTGIADRLPYFSGANTMSLATLTAFARTLLDDSDAATARATLGLGDVATLTKQSSALDSTSGRALLVGAFGLGGIGNVPAASADYSTLGAISQVLADGATSSPADKPTSGRAHAGLHLASSATRWVQLMAEVAGGSDLNRLWWRRNYNGTVSAWRQLFGQGNILGTVNQASGVPTGALIEAGSNANGNYVRFADGLQICRRDYSMGARNTLGSGTLSDPYRTNQADVAFAATFAAAPMVVVTAYCDDSTAANRRMSFGHRRAETTQIVQLQGVAITSEAGSGTVIASIVAIGRWF